MMHVEAGLVLFSLEQSIPRILLQNGRIPIAVVRDSGTVEEFANKLLRSLTGLEALVNGSGWVALRWRSLIDDPKRMHVGGTRCITIIFTGLVPESVSDIPGDCSWVPMDKAVEIMSPEEYSAVLECAR